MVNIFSIIWFFMLGKYMKSEQINFFLFHNFLLFIELRLLLLLLFYYGKPWKDLELGSDYFIL